MLVKSYTLSAPFGIPKPSYHTLFFFLFPTVLTAFLQASQFTHLLCLPFIDYLPP